MERILRTEENRPDYDTWFMAIARVVALRSTCARRAVGAVVIDDTHRILSTGYNGTPSGMMHCTTTPCGGTRFGEGLGLDECQALHAEQNAIARLQNVRFADTLYCSTAPCVMCTKLIAATPIRRIVAGADYAKSGRDFWLSLGGKEWSQM